MAPHVTRFTESTPSKLPVGPLSALDQRHLLQRVKLARKGERDAARHQRRQEIDGRLSDVVTISSIPTS